MGSTVKRGYPIPNPVGDPPNGRDQMRALGAAIDLDVDLLATGYRLLTVVRFATPGVGAFVKGNYTGIRAVTVDCTGSGGGSAGAVATSAAQKAVGGPGGGGAFARSYLILASSLAASENVTVGAAGAAGGAGTDGGDGGFTQFGTAAIVKAAGGLHGLSTGAFANTGAIGFSNGGSGGSAASSVGDIVIDGNDAPVVSWYNSEVPHAALAGAAAAGPYGTVTMPTGAASSYNGRAGRAFGSGAAGSYNNISQAARPGAASSGGLCIVYVYV